MDWKIGIKHGYPIISIFLNKLPIYAQLSRPFTMFSAFMVGWLLGLKIYGLFTLYPLLVGLAFAFGQGFGQIVNQIYDIEIDKINKPYRPLPSGKITVKEAWTLSLIYLAISIICSVLVNMRFAYGNAILVTMAYFYSVPPIRAKQHVWSVAWIAVSRGLLPPIIVSISCLGYLDKILGLVSIIAFLWVLAYQPTKDIGDVEGDRKYGVKTLPVVLGVSGTVKYMYFMTILLAVAVLFSISMGFSVVGLAILPIGVCIPKMISRETITENNFGWMLFYVGLALIYLAVLI